MTDLTHRTAFRCTEDEFYQIKDQASEHGFNVSEYLLWLVMMDGKSIDGDEFDMKGGEN